ncbi:MAG: hypothetical protein ABIF85_04180 [Nanoarchaeota archaeon]|nr:hypothetical protein [Nanoarchaeota archaeon]MBU4300319.1 hypothetical protein [Nanoarchaeota archaeon]MBU4452594.1 hypothetical protein [Nanoarchaeota archaeon]MCG2723562.1 hypothetical protein [archaeon]
MKEEELLKKSLINLIKSADYQLGILENGGTELNVIKLYGRPETRKMALYCILDLLKPYKFNSVVGRGIGGTPIATEVADARNANLVLYSPKSRDRTGNALKAYNLEKTDTIVLVDDVISRNKYLGIKTMISEIEKTKADLVGCFFIAKTNDVVWDLDTEYAYVIDAKKDIFNL